MESNISKTFESLKCNNKFAIIPYVTAGFPTLDYSFRICKELEKRGANLIEIGIPFSDPIADGPTIQKSCFTALKNNIKLTTIFNLLSNLSNELSIPIIVMTYLNIVYKFGEEKFFKKIKDCGVDGIILTDLPPEESKNFLQLSNEYKIDTIFLITPVSSEERIKWVSTITKGFIYIVSTTGTTGARKKLFLNNLKSMIKKVRKFSNKPACIGFGISKKEHIKAISKFADGAIIGSAIIDKIEHCISKKMTAQKLIKTIGDYFESLTL